MAEGRESLKIYRQAPISKVSQNRPTNLAKVREVMQGPTEPPSVFLERLIEAYRYYTPFNQQAVVAMAFKDYMPWLYKI